jgi:hypothetical protein
LIIADLNHHSNDKMSRHDADAMARLNRAVEIAELSPSRMDDYARMRASRNQVKTPAQIAKDGFPKFKQLPSEIRSMIWRAAMQPYGIYTVLLLGREEPMPQQPAAPAPMVFRVVYRLEPVPRDQQDVEMQMRLDTMRAIQRANSEAASEVNSAFPTTINCTGGKLRFNAEHDSLSLSDLQCYLGGGFLQRFTRYTQGGVVFENDWHKIPRVMLFNNGRLWRSFNVVDGRLGAVGLSDSQALEGFMMFLTDCTNLRTTGFVYDRACEYPTALMEHHPAFLDIRHDPLSFSDLAPMMRGSFYERRWEGSSSHPLQNFMAGFKGLQAFVGGLPPGKGVTSQFQSMRFGRQELQHLLIKAVLPVCPRLYGVIQATRDKHSVQI